MRLLGVGLVGFVDGIVVCELVQWHHPEISWTGTRQNDCTERPPPRPARRTPNGIGVHERIVRLALVEI